MNIANKLTITVAYQFIVSSFHYSALILSKGKATRGWMKMRQSMRPFKWEKLAKAKRTSKHQLLHERNTFLALPL